MVVRQRFRGPDFGRALLGFAFQDRIETERQEAELESWLRGQASSEKARGNIPLLSGQSAEFRPVES